MDNIWAAMQTICYAEEELSITSEGEAAVLTDRPVFRDMKPCSSTYRYWRFGRAWFLHLQGRL